MKRIMCLAIAAVLLLCGCGGGQGTETSDFDVHEAMSAMLEASPIDDALELSQDDMLNFFGIEAETMEDFAAVTSADGITAKELVIVKAKDAESAESVREHLQNRLDGLTSSANNYLPEEYAVLQECSVRTDGVYVALIISPDEASLNEIYSGFAG